MVQCYFRELVLCEPAAQKRHVAGRSQIWKARFNLFHHFLVCIQAGNEDKRRGICSWHISTWWHHTHARTHAQIELLQCALTWQSKDYISKIGRKLLWVTDKVLVLAGWLAFSFWRLAALHLVLWVRRPWESWTGSVRESTILADSALLTNRWEKCPLQQQQKVLFFIIGGWLFCWSYRLGTSYCDVVVRKTPELP